ncbi:membrane-spanning 4-domains subfamily A member 13 isoform X2 [Sarcophilus harrisii]|uniref:membrane-spanning 4-domains subfamily A member 13 isoform X2 n=1 Tax=Sarcophilus harrisii TaxID=9305 RepID=UPI001301C40F|nr:membrane-spanning 4-domains subfamily A member 13 isoform X2 [Sarcophilus harrisii]
MLGKAVMGTLPLRFPILTPSSRCAVRGLCLPVALGRTAGLRKVTRPPAGHGAAPTGEDTPRRTPAVSGPGAEGRRLRRGRTVTARREECMGRQVSPTCAPNRPFFMSGILSVNEAKNTSVQSRKLAFFGNVFVGKIVSGFLLLTSLLEFSLTFTYIYYIVCNWDSLMQKHMIHTDMGPDVQGTPCVEVEKEKKREEDGEWSMEKKVEEEKEQLEDNGKSKLKLEAAF